MITDAGTIEDRIRAVGTELSTTIGRVLGHLPGPAHRPNGLARELGINRATASRLLGAMATKDPMEVVHLIPGPEPLRQLVQAAGVKSVPEDLVADALAAISRFDALIRQDAGTRGALDAMISSSLPGAREKFELSCKYSIFKGMSQLKGARADAWLGTAVVEPSATRTDRLDLTWLNGAIALQRLRPGVTVRFSYRHDVNGQRENIERADLLSLERFCTNPPAQLEARRTGEVINYVLPPDLLGPRSVTDLFVVDHHPAAMRRHAREDDEAARSSLFVEPALPVAVLVFDVLLHEDVFPGAEPGMTMYDTSHDGIANVNDRSRDIDRMDMHESIEFLGAGMDGLYAPEVPRYADILQHLAGEYGWNPSRFRGYRMRIQYPVYGWQICMTFRPPARA